MTLAEIHLDTFEPQAHELLAEIEWFDFADATDGVIRQLSAQLLAMPGFRGELLLSLTVLLMRMKRAGGLPRLPAADRAKGAAPFVLRAIAHAICRCRPDVAPCVMRGQVVAKFKRFVKPLQQDPPGLMAPPWSRQAWEGVN